jgi:predicted nucleotidyltransferase
LTTNRITPLIIRHLHRIAAEKNIRILYACETGSRGWGFASPDSDYDIRFVFVHPQDKYLSIEEPLDNINTIFEDGGEVLDFNAWDLRKTLHHLRKSNASPLEWLQSPIVYEQEGNFQHELWAMAPLFFNPQTAVHHYLGICNNSIKTGIADGHIKIKKYFYILRPLLAAMWAADRRTIPPMEFRLLLAQISDNTPLITAINHLWEEKERSVEGHVIPLIPLIQAFIASEMERCKSMVWDARQPDADPEILDVFFRKMLIP